MNIVKYITPRYNPDLVMFEYGFPLSKRHIARGVYKDYMIKYDFHLQDSLQSLYSELDRIDSSEFLCNLYNKSYMIRGFSRWLINNKKSAFAKFFDKNFLEIKWITSYVKKEKDWGSWKEKDEYFTVDESIRRYSALANYLDSLNIGFATYSLKVQTNKRHPGYPHPHYYVTVKLEKELILPNEGHANDKGHAAIAKNLFVLLKNSSSLSLKKYKVKN